MARSLAALKVALQTHDARAACELIVPISRPGLRLAARHRELTSTRAQRHASSGQCVGFGDHGELQVFSRALNARTLGRLTVRGAVATVVLSAPHQADAPAKFVLLDGRWRLAFAAG